MAARLRGLSVLLAVFKFLGGFPYSWDFTSSADFSLAVSAVALIWTGVVVTTILVMSQSTLIPAYSTYSNTEIGKVLKYMLKTCWYLLVNIFYLYLAIRSRLLAKILKSLAEVKVTGERFYFGFDDVLVLLCVLVFLVADFGSLAYEDFGHPKDLYDNISSVIDRMTDVTIVVFILLIYALVKLISAEMESTVMAVIQDLKQVKTINLVGVSSRWNTHWKCEPRTLDFFKRKSSNVSTNNSTDFVLLKVEHHTSPEASVHNDVSHDTSRVDSCRALRILELDGVFEQVVNYGGVPIALLLLNTICATTVFLYNAVTKSNIVHAIFFAILTSRLVQMTLIPDPLIIKRESCVRQLTRLCNTLQHDHDKLRQAQAVRAVVAEGPTFNVLGFFTLGRHTLLTVASFVATYLVITLQFAVSETPQSQEAVNCSLNNASSTR